MQAMHLISTLRQTIEIELVSLKIYLRKLREWFKCKLNLVSVPLEPLIVNLQNDLTRYIALLSGFRGFK